MPAGTKKAILTGYVLIFKPVWSLLINPLDVEDLTRWEAAGQFVSFKYLTKNVVSLRL